MAEYIEKEELLKRIKRMNGMGGIAVLLREDVENAINNSFAVEIPANGWWIHDINNLYGCSECGGRETMSPKKLKNYCPNCGARMDGD